MGTQNFIPMIIVDQLTQDTFQVAEQQEDVIARAKREARNLSSQVLASMMMRRRPNAAQAILASKSAAQRQALVEEWLANRETGAAGANGLSLLLRALPLIPVLIAVAYFLSNNGGDSGSAF